MDLLGSREISARHFEILRHGAELDVVRAQNVAELAQRFLRPHVGAGVGSAVVSGKKQFDFLPRLPALAFAQDPSGFGALNVAADPGLEDKIHHAAEPPAWAGHS